MMKIILLRHGKPEIDLQSMLKKRCSLSDLKRLVSSYDLAGLSKDDKVSDDIVDLVASSNIVIHGDLQRSIDSVKALELNSICHYPDPLFREPNLPFENWNYLQLPLIVWFVFYRVLWYFGYSNNAESLSKANCPTHIVP